MVICNHNCLECPYPDVPKACLRGNLTSREKTRVRERDRRYYQANKERCKAYRRSYYAAHREEFLEYYRTYRVKNQEKYRAEQSVIKSARETLGLTQGQLAQLCGVSTPTICMWETGSRKANWEKVYSALPILRKNL